MKRFLLLFFVFCSFGVCFGAEFAADSEMNSILACVNGEAITLVDVLPLTRSRELQAMAVYSGERLEQAIWDYRRKVVDELIDSILIQAEFSRLDFSLDNQDVEREIDQFAISIGCRSREQLDKMLRKDGSNIDEVRMGIRKNMMVQMMLYRQIRISVSVSPKELFEYFKNNEEKFATREKVGLAMLKLDASDSGSEDEIAAVSAALAADPDSFASLVSKYSPELGDGNLGEIDSNLLRPEFAAAFEKFVPGMTVGPVKVYDGVVWLKVLSYTPAEKAEFRAVEREIKNALESEQREKVISGYISRLRSQAVIEYFF